MSLVRVCLCVLQENDICSFPVIATKRPKFSLDKGWCASFQSLALSVYDGAIFSDEQEEGEEVFHLAGTVPDTQQSSKELLVRQKSLDSFSDYFHLLLVPTGSYL